jgi:sugar phosphate isomerase/epimerase
MSMLGWPIFAMDTSFFTSLGAYDFDARCEMLAELGYDATYLTLWNDRAWADLPRLAGVGERHGLGVAAVYASSDVARSVDEEPNARILDLLRTVQGCDVIELSMQSSDPSLEPSSTQGDDRAAHLLEAFLDAADERGLTLCLYPHQSYWIEKVADAVRLCRRLDRPSLALTFCAYHWYAVDSTSPLPQVIEEAAPWLRSANISGSRKATGDASLPSHEPLDDGEFDIFAALGLLRVAGYRGMVGVQGYSVGGDVYRKLERSLASYRGMIDRLDRHPMWADLRWRAPLA